LLDHHREITLQFPPANKPVIKRYLLAYGTLCTRAGVAYLTRNPGPFLEEIADWCKHEGWPPLNALAINAQLGHPGDGYDGAASFCNLLN